MKGHYGTPLDDGDDEACAQLRRNAGPAPPVLGSWAALIVWLVDEHLHGAFHAMARHLGRSSALIYQWRDGQTQLPELGSVDLIARTYGLDRSHVMDIALGPAHRVRPQEATA